LWIETRKILCDQTYVWIRETLIKSLGIVIASAALESFISNPSPIRSAPIKAMHHVVQQASGSVNGTFGGKEKSEQRV
jgi:hypothetical protein